ncbi:hypothetical protein, partial [Pseudomonas syringae]|uniref:hypothetical protein n=1 Tax=Pseudomonas syringae TaxID=317 RepID=UPI001CA5ABCF
LKLELEGVFNAVCLGLSHVVSLRLLRHLARDTFFRGKVSTCDNAIVHDQHISALHIAEDFLNEPEAFG